MAAIKFPDAAGETGCTRSGNVVTLTGLKITNGRTFQEAEDDTKINFNDGDKVTVNILDASGNTATWLGTYATAGNTITKITEKSSTGSLETTNLTVYAVPGGYWFEDLENYRVVLPGTSFPVGTDFPNGIIPDGLMFYHQTRKILYSYEQGWITKTYFDPSNALKLYVDIANGTDDDDHGFGETTNAYETIAYALTKLPLESYSGIHIQVAAGTYSDPLPFPQIVFVSGGLHIECAYTTGTAYQISTIADSNGTDARDLGCLITMSGSPAWSGSGKIIKVTTGTAADSYYLGRIFTSNTVKLPSQTDEYSMTVDADGVPTSVINNALDTTSYLAVLTLGVTISGQITARPEYESSVSFATYTGNVAIGKNKFIFAGCLASNIQWIADNPAYILCSYLHSTAPASYAYTVSATENAVNILGSHIESDSNGVGNSCVYTTPLGNVPYSRIRGSVLQKTGDGYALYARSGAVSEAGNNAQHASCFYTTSTSASYHAIRANGGAGLHRYADTDNKFWRGYGGGETGAAARNVESATYAWETSS